MEIRKVYWIIAGVMAAAFIAMAAVTVIEDLPMNTFPAPVWIAVAVAIFCPLAGKRKRQKENSNRD